MTSPVYSSGVTTSTFMIGSIRRGSPWPFSSRKATAGRDFEGQDGRVDIVEGTVDQRGLEVGDRIAGQQAAFLGRFEALLDARDVFLRHRTADDLRFRTRSPNPASAARTAA
jgi:hypothetical protein